MDLKYSTREFDGINVFTLEFEELNHELASELKEIMFTKISEGRNKFILDLSNVKTVDSSGLGSLLFGKRQANSQNGDLLLVGVAESVQNLLRIAQLSRVFEIYDNVDDALTALK